MPMPDHLQMPRNRPALFAQRKPPSLRINTPAQNPDISLVLSENTTTSSLSSSNSDSESASSPSPVHSQPQKKKSMRNAKKLTLSLPSANSNQSSNSLPVASDGESNHNPDARSDPAPSPPQPKRQTSNASMTNSLASRMHRKDENDSSTSPYADGPVEILPGIWLGNEDNAVDWKALSSRGIRSILNVAREVISPFDSDAAERTTHLVSDDEKSTGTYYPPRGPRPAMNYLKLPWSHGQPELVKDGFVSAMAFVDSARQRGEGVLIQ
jgi:tyrosine-protein phosphatase MSG5